MLGDGDNLSLNTRERMSRTYRRNEAAKRPERVQVLSCTGCGWWVCICEHFKLAGANASARRSRDVAAAQAIPDGNHGDNLQGAAK
jgi:hypothetical protein